MKHIPKTRISILLILCFMASVLSISAQDTAKAEPVIKAEPAVKVRYFSNNNNIQYLIVKSVIGKKLLPLPMKVVNVYLDSVSADNLITKTTTDNNGKSIIFIPITFQDKWKSKAKHNFIAVMEAATTEEEITAELEVTKSKIEIDTSSNEEGVRSISVKVMFFENNAWVPAPDVEMRVGVSRLGGILSAGDAETYTTDSTGSVSVEFKRDSLAGDLQGNYILAAKVEDNDSYGNLLVEKTVPWGVAYKPDTTFFSLRNLWTTQFRSPYWLLFMAYSIVFGVWGTMIYLIRQMWKIKKLGDAVGE